ncbi:MAG: FUSC family protein [Bryobacteraceae bacterium]
MFSRAASLESAKQATKTAIAGVISLYVTYLFHLPQGYWAAISALIVMQSNVGATLSASRTRLAGTAVGALVGGLFVGFFGTNILGFALAVAIAFFVCDSLRLAESQRLATVTVAIIMLIPSTSLAWVIALHRFAEVALGILVALLVSLILWPNHARRIVRQGLAGTLSKLAALYRAVMRNYRLEEAASMEGLKSDVSAAIQKNSGLLQNALQEAFGPLKERERLALLAHQVERIFGAVESVELAVRDSSSDTYARNFQTGLEQLEDGVSMALETMAKSIAAGRLYPEWPNLPAMIAALDEQAAQAREARTSMHYPLDEILRFYSLLLSSRNLIGELELAHSLADSGSPAQETLQ